MLQFQTFYATKNGTDHTTETHTRNKIQQINKNYTQNVAIYAMERTIYNFVQVKYNTKLFGATCVVTIMNVL